MQPLSSWHVSSVQQHLLFLPSPMTAVKNNGFVFIILVITFA
jgi:hypothetical protein